MSPPVPSPLPPRPTPPRPKPLAEADRMARGLPLESGEAQPAPPARPLH